MAFPSVLCLMGICTRECARALAFLQGVVYRMHCPAMLRESTNMSLHIGFDCIGIDLHLNRLTHNKHQQQFSSRLLHIPYHSLGHFTEQVSHSQRNYA